VSDAPVLTPRVGRSAQIVRAAREILESQGPEALTMRSLGAAIDIRAPSLYKHFSSKRAVEIALIEEGLLESGQLMYHAVAKPGRRSPIAALLATYRAVALANPNLYRLMTSGSLPRTDLTPGLEDWAGKPFSLATGDPYLGQALWAFAHGMVVLEIDRRFYESSNLDRTWRSGARAFERAQK
jgi:AcrR family transcriptional regulator